MTTYTYVRKPDSTQLVWTSFLMPFSADVWLCLIVSLPWMSTALLQHDNRCGKHRARDGPLLQFYTVTFSHVTPLGLQCERLPAKKGVGLHPNLHCAIFSSHSLAIMAPVLTFQSLRLTLCTTSFNIQKSCVLPTTHFCFVWIS
jgi:hypothetical protein